MVKKVEEAMALPEVRSSMFRDDGTRRPLSGNGISGDDIIMFVDADGRVMNVIETEDGPAKCEFWL